MKTKQSFCSSLVVSVLSTRHRIQVTRNQKKWKEEWLEVAQGITFSDTVKNVLLWPNFFLDSRDLTQHGSVEGAWKDTSLDGLTLHSSPGLQSGLRQDELWRRLRQDVVAKYLLGRRRRCWRHAHCVQKHWSALLVLRPNWWWVVEVLEAGRDLKECKRLEGRETHFVHMGGNKGVFLSRTFNTET